jgi:glycosyltransferase involved in cell wall biosynthesis
MGDRAMGPEDGDPAKIRVLWLIKGLALGGAERLLVSFAGLADHRTFRYEAAYILPSLSTLAPALRDASVSTSCIGSDDHFDVRWLARLRQRLLAEPVDVLHLHLPYVAALAGIVVRTVPASRRPRTVYTQHSMWQAISPPLRLLLRLVIPRFDAVIAVSAGAQQSMPRRLRERVRVIVHGVVLDDARGDEDDRRRTRRELGISDDEVVIVSVANLRREKGHDVLLQAAQVLLRDDVPVRFLLVGDGELAGDVRALHSALDLDDRVRFLGSRLDAIRILAASDVFVLASLHEGFPVSLMEALAVGVPVVATAVGGVPEAITPGVEGLVVPPGSVDLLAEAIRQVATDADLRHRMAAAAARKGTIFDMRQAVREVEGLYRTLASTR